MDLPDDLAIIHQPARLKIMGLLYRHRDVAYTTARDATGLTDGNLATHTRRLQDAEMLDARRVLRGRDGFELRYRITKAGAEAFRRYLGVLRAFLENAD